MSSTSHREEEEEGGYGGEGRKKKKKKKYYAVARGRSVGVYDTWDECNAQVRAYPGASHKVYISRRILCIFPFFFFPLLEELSALLLCAVLPL
jgi:hypothetical protein